jgi:uncharacterized Zn finger protein
MKIPGLSVQTIESNADEGSITRGRDYFESGAVTSLRRTAEDEIEAYVQGSDLLPYHVKIKHSNEGVSAAECTCPYVEGSWCRHIVATLFSVLASGGGTDRSLNQMLDEFDRIELIHMMERLAEGHPDIIPVIEAAYRQQKGS